jgi:hypothetical protein
MAQAGTTSSRRGLGGDAGGGSGSGGGGGGTSQQHPEGWHPERWHPERWHPERWHPERWHPEGVSNAARGLSSSDEGLSLVDCMVHLQTEQQRGQGQATINSQRIAGLPRNQSISIQISRSSVAIMYEDPRSGGTPKQCHLIPLTTLNGRNSIQDSYNSDTVSLNTRLRSLRRRDLKLILQVTSSMFQDSTFLGIPN